MRRLLLCAATLAGVGLSASSASAALLFSWENDAQGWANTAGFSTTTGVTDGSYSMIRDVPTGWNNSLGTGYGNTFMAPVETNTHLSVDITYPGVIPAGSFFQIQMQLIGRVSYYDSTLYVPLVGGGTLNHLTWDYASTETVAPATNYEHIRFITNTNFVPGNLYFDNLQVNTVPEPASLSLLGLGALGLIRRRQTVG